ncbi:MAG: TIM barrel protein [Chloroflexi bacterium]|nr:TIM barrel protein [Chloroflexota bacterium]
MLTGLQARRIKACGVDRINPNVHTSERFYAEVGSTHLKVQLDIYHARMAEGDLRGHLRRHIREIGHVQVSGYPVREEPGAGEYDVAALFEQLDHLGYGGWIGCEYTPRGDTTRGLAWARPWLDPRYW